MFHEQNGSNAVQTALNSMITSHQFERPSSQPDSMPQLLQLNADIPLYDHKSSKPFSSDRDPSPIEIRPNEHINDTEQPPTVLLSDFNQSREKSNRTALSELAANQKPDLKPKCTKVQSVPPGSRIAFISPNERIFNQQQADVDPEMRTIITKTRAALKDVKEHFRDAE